LSVRKKQRGKVKNSQQNQMERIKDALTLIAIAAFVISFMCGLQGEHEQGIYFLLLSLVILMIRKGSI
jgi:magnesium-transporting ATPase (P-type)